MAVGLVLGAAAMACSAAPVAERAGGDGEAGPAGEAAGTSPAKEAPGSASASPPAQTGGPIGVVVIDEQKVFFDTAARRNAAAATASLVERSAHVFALAAQKKLPFFVTFEASTAGDHALPPALASALPANARSFVKTTFAATGQPDFAHAIATGGAARLVVIGAETDVCVLQTVLGLRRGGHEVFALVDAMFTEEVDSAPALRRMRQAGVRTIGMKEADELLGSLAPTPSTPPSTAPVVKPFGIGILLHGVEHLGDADPNASPKMVRLRELLLVSEWFGLPVFAVDPATTTAALPSGLRAILTRPIQPLASRPANVTQLAVAGAHAGVAEAVAGLSGDVFLVEDALVGGGAAGLAPLEEKGAVPSTYKTLYYELIESVDDAGWPSQQWVADGERYYYDATMAPEELPPLSPE